ncbi:MAG: Rpn family recombination-promoting nuclease/putative transposase [Bacillota bacterium]
MTVPIDHDRLFKELLETFFVEFMGLFFREASQFIDFSHLKFLSQEVFTDVTVGEKRAIDILVETKLKDEKQVILVHVESQSYVQKEFGERMFIYFSRLYEKHRCKILPIAVFSYDKMHDEIESFELGFSFLDVLKFNFYKLELRKLHWREFIKSDNPVAAALLSKMGYRKEEKVQVKLEFLRMLARMQMDPARAELIGGFFHSCLRLNKQEQEQFEEEVNRLGKKEAEIIMQLTTPWHEKGRIEGNLEGQSALVLKLLKKRFGEVPEDLEKLIKSLNSERLEAVGEALLDIKNIEELRRMIH